LQQIVDRIMATAEREAQERQRPGTDRIVTMIEYTLAPGGVTPAVHYLLDAYSRLDVFEYAPGRRLKVVTWDPDAWRPQRRDSWW
jgi:hypothetical protein